jgi:transcriptional regulator with XRE-family HTH domain
MDIVELGIQLKQLRKDNKISQQQLADDLGLSRLTINSVEKATTNTGIYTILKILDYFGYELAIREKSAFPTFEELRANND